jgi:hypothetical protein
VTQPGNKSAGRRRVSISPGNAKNHVNERHGGPSKRGASREQELRDLFSHLVTHNRRVAFAILAIMEIAADIDRQRAARLLESVSMIVVFASRRDGKGMRS